MKRTWFVIVCLLLVLLVSGCSPSYKEYKRLVFKPVTTMTIKELQFMADYCARKSAQSKFSLPSMAWSQQALVYQKELEIRVIRQ